MSRLAVGVAVGQRPEQVLDGMLGAHTGQRRAALRGHLVGVLGQQPREATRAGEGVDTQLPRSGSACRVPLVQPHQAVLDQRKLVLTAPGIGDQPLGELAGHLTTVQSRRFADRAQHVLVTHPR